MYQISDEHFIKIFKKEPEHHFETGGRFEILGNHTDHNHGLCIVGCASLKIYASVGLRNDSIVNIISLNSSRFSFSVSGDIQVDYGDYGKSAGMAKGVCIYLKEHGYKIGGFNAVFASDVPVGAGVSSSAAYQLIIGEIINDLFNDGKIDKIVLAKAGQFAENKYFLKASGLLDQIGVSYGGINAIDFKHIEDPKITHFNKKIPGIHYVLVSSGGSHSKLSDLYSAIPADMKKVANALGVEFLRESNLDALRDSYHENIANGLFTKDQALRAYHYYTENIRVEKAIEALEKDDYQTFLNLINESQDSSQENLRNTMIEGQYEGSPQEAIDYARKYIGNGACKINGGGFAGTIICLVPDEVYPNFMEKMKEKYGDKVLIEIGLNLNGAKMLD